MALRYHNFNCVNAACEHEFECFVDNSGDDAYKADPCPACGTLGATVGISRKINHISSYVPDYPGANQHRAGYANLRQVPEKKGRQISMSDGGKKKTLNASSVPAPKIAAR